MYFLHQLALSFSYIIFFTFPYASLANYTYILIIFSFRLCKVIEKTYNFSLLKNQIKMSNEKKEESFFKKILHSPQVEVILNILFIVMAITSMVSCIKAYGLLRSASADFGNIAVNWNTKPLMYGKC